MRLHPPLDDLVITWPFGATSPNVPGVMHRGVDLRAAIGTPVYAAADGAAVALSQHDQGFGRYVRLDLGRQTLDGWDGSRLAGDVVVYYAHLSEQIPSQPVTRGQMVGQTGNTGNSTGAHLHWEVRVDMVSVDPMLYVEGLMERLEQVGELATALRWELEEAQREDNRAAT